MAFAGIKHMPILQWMRKFVSSPRPPNLRFTIYDLRKLRSAKDGAVPAPAGAMALSKMFRFIVVLAAVLSPVFNGCRADNAPTFDANGSAWFESQHLDEGVAYFSKQIQQNTNDGIAYFRRGICYMLKGQGSNAMLDLTCAITLLKTNAGAFFIQGNVYYDMKNYDKAIDDYSSALRINPLFERGYVERARCHYLKGNYDASIVDCDSALAINPNLWDAYDIRGNAYLHRSRLIPAVADFDKAIQLEPTNSVDYYNKGFALDAEGDFQDAITNMTEAIKLDPQNASAYSQRGWDFYKVGDSVRAIEDFEKTVSIHPEYETLNNLAWILTTTPNSKLRNGKKALEYAKTACDLTGWKNSICLGTLAAAYAETGQFTNAIKWQKLTVEGMSGKDRAEAERILALYQDGKSYQR